VQIVDVMPHANVCYVYMQIKMARCVNSNVSTSAVSRAEKVVNSELLVIGLKDNNNLI